MALDVLEEVDLLRLQLARARAEGMASLLQLAKAHQTTVEANVCIKYGIGAADSVDINTGAITRKASVVAVPAATESSR